MYIISCENMPNPPSRIALKVLKELAECSSGDTATGIANALNISRDKAAGTLQTLERDGFARTGEVSGVFVTTSKGKEAVGCDNSYW